MKTIWREGRCPGPHWDVTTLLRPPWWWGWVPLPRTHLVLEHQPFTSALPDLQDTSTPRIPCYHWPAVRTNRSHSV